MTWRSTPRPDPNDPVEIEFYRNWYAKHTCAKRMMEDLGIKYEPITFYPQGLPDGMVSMIDLYDLFSDPEKLEKLLEKIKK